MCCSVHVYTRLTEALAKVQRQTDTLYRIRGERDALRDKNENLNRALAKAQAAYKLARDSLKRIAGSSGGRYAG
jgi:uncharacterized phage infection (PIP) family protein YhgE